MNKARLVFIALFFLVLASFKQDNLPIEFSELLSRTKLTFIKPAGMIETKCLENRQMNYEYALKYNDKNFEVRYAIRPIDSALVQYDKAKKRGDLMIHPNNWGSAAFQASLLNIGLGGTESGNLPEIAYFDSTAVKNEFNADWGATAFVNLGEEFGGKTFKYCTVVLIHKDFVGDAYVFYVSDSKENISELMELPFHSLRFK